MFQAIGEVLQAALDAPNLYGLKSKRGLIVLVLPMLFKGDLEKTGPEKMKYSVTIKLY